MADLRIRRRPIAAASGLACAALLAAGLAFGPALHAADDDSGPELDKQRVATCEARGGRLARNHLGQMLCKDAKVKLKAYLKQHPEAAVAAAPAAAPVAPAPGVTAKGPEYAPVPGSTHEVPAGPPTMPPPQPTDIPGGGGTGGVGVGGGGGKVAPPGGKTPPPAVPPALQPTKTPGGTCYLRACFYQSYNNTCSCQEWRSAELCQFKETTPGGTCSTSDGTTTALCPAGYSCIRNRCDRKPVC